MPADLRRAHTANDRAVDAAYAYKGDKSDPARVAFCLTSTASSPACCLLRSPSANCV